MGHIEIVSAEELQILVSPVFCGAYVILVPRVTLQEILSILTTALVHIAVH